MLFSYRLGIRKPAVMHESTEFSFDANLAAAGKWPLGEAAYGKAAAGRGGCRGVASGKNVGKATVGRATCRKNAGKATVGRAAVGRTAVGKNAGSNASWKSARRTTLSGVPALSKRPRAVILVPEPQKRPS